jgi:uncharacterized sulfatase
MLTRRQFTASAALAATPAPRPNILWLTCEDIGPNLGCYGDRYATTPNLDRLAARGTLYRRAWSNAPVCAPARTTIISGLYPTATGAEHMRSMTRLPEPLRLFPCYLREAGYYTSNHVKEDYNLAHTGKVWDDSSNTGHWRHRAPGQPFFSVFNFTITHESQIRTRPHTRVHDPARAPLPSYHPDTPEVRQDWAQYYDNITTMDSQAAAVLAQLEEDRLADSTIVVFFGDHGSGMPRHKRWPYNSGLGVPLIVSIPERFGHLASPDYRRGGGSGRMVGFIDLAPTMLSLAGLQPPAHLHGHAFLGAHQAAPQRYLYGFRGRMDERIDSVRSVRDERFVYVRNYMPHRPYGQHLTYMFQTPATRIWKQLYDAGHLRPPQTYFWEPKPAEELYDLAADHDEVHNLATRPEHRETLARFRAAERAQALRVRDVGLLAESDMHLRAGARTPYELGQASAYPMERILDTAHGRLRAETALADPDAGVRYQAALQLLIARRPMPGRLLEDPSPAVRITAAEALADLETLIAHADATRHGIYTALQALNAISALGPRAASLKPRVAALPRLDPHAHMRMKDYLGRIIDDILAGRR